MLEAVAFLEKRMQVESFDAIVIGAEFGFSAGDVEVKMARIKARKDEIVLKSRSGVQQWMRG